MNRMLLILLLLAGTPQMAGDTGVFAQGIYSRNAAASENERENERETGQSNGNDGGGLFRAGGKENPTDGGQASKISPVKDGWGILVIAGIGYGCCIALRKKRDGYAGESREA